MNAVSIFSVTQPQYCGPIALRAQCSAQDGPGRCPWVTRRSDL